MAAYTAERDYQRELNSALDYLTALSKEDPQTLQKKLYDSFSALTYLAVEGKDANFRQGWATGLTDSHNNPLFSKDEAAIVESVSLNTVKPMFDEASYNKEQEGGKPSLAPIQSKTGIITKVRSLVKPEDLSIDSIYWNVKDYMEKLDRQAHDISREFGPFRYFYETSIDPRFPLPVPTTTPPFITVIMVPIPARAIPVFIGVLVEAIRLIFTVGVGVTGVGTGASDLARNILSIVLGLIDLFKGEWKHALLSFAGVFGEAPLIIGLIGKIMLNMFGLIAPDLQERLIFDLYQSKKSMIMGAFLWLFATFSPDYIRQAVRERFNLIKKFADNSNNQIQKIQAAMQKSVGPAGLKIDFDKVNENYIPSFDDIQNLQSIARQPAIFCSREFQEAIAPLRVIPPARFLLEMMSIPTSQKSLEMECRGTAGLDIETTMEQALLPNVSVKPGSKIETALGVDVPGAKNIKEPNTRKGGARRRRNRTQRRYAK